MKHFFIFALINLALSCTAFAQNAYPLVCKFDGTSAGWSAHPANMTKMLVYKSFKKSSKPASAGLAEGYCSWTDRGMTDSEPSIIGHEMPNVTTIHQIDNNGTKVYITAPTIWAASTIVKGKEITFQVYTGNLTGISVPVLILKSY